MDTSHNDKSRGGIMESESIRLRALEPEDVDVLYRWENDTTVWKVSNTVAPFSKHVLRRFIEEQRQSIYETGQLRLIVEQRGEERAIGAIDLFDIDPYNRRAGVGILIYEERDKGRGYASAALAMLIRYCFEILILNQIYCNVPSGNGASLALFQGRGFTVVGIKKEWIKTTADWQDEIMLQLINPVK
jgi:diamine N-acetyltransferase